jgi:diguanylate cyclase
MKKQVLHSMPDTTVPEYANALHPHIPGYGDAGNPASAHSQLHQSLAELKQVLADSQQQLKAAQQQIGILSETNARLRQKLIRLAKKCEKARHFAYHDQLTGLPNRGLLIDRLKQTIAQSVRQHKQVVLLFIDLDRFKSVNDSLGHAVGDKLLQQVADRLVSCVRYGDTVCRYGGDEFVIMLTDIVDAQESEAVVEKIRARLSTSYVLDGNLITVTASIGTAIHRADGQNYSDLIIQADNAMYFAKAHQPNNPKT